MAEVGVPAGRQLLAFANAAHEVATPGASTEAAERLRTTREQLRAVVGDGGVVEAAATVAIFNALVRIADGTGIELDAGVLADSADFREAAGINDFAGAANTRTTPVEVDRAAVDQLFT